MKRLLSISILLSIVIMGHAQPKEDYLGLPGDNLNLYAVMKLFQESETLEGFEKSLNDENSKINNLDLDGDNYIDYIRVIDYPDGNLHTIVLQVPVSRNENQDVAVFTVQRENNGQVYIQLIGDEALYGKNYIIEPYYDTAGNGSTPNPGYMGNTTTEVTIVHTSPDRIAYWPVVRYIYLPTYTPWHSSWYWGYYPPYWRPWRPYYWHYYYGFHYNWHSHYYGHYHRYPSYRHSHYNDFYYHSKRVTSVNVSVRVKSDSYKSTYSRPEMRSKGEADFVKANPTAGRREADKSSVSATSRRSESSDVNRSNSAAANGSRRAEQTSKSSERNSGSNESAARRSTGEEMSKAASNNASRRINTKVESSRKSSSSSAGSAERRSSAGSSSKSSGSAKSSESRKAAETTKPDRRK